MNAPASRAQLRAPIAADLRALERALAARIRPESRTAPAMFEGGGANEFLLVRGSPRAPREIVPRGFLTALRGPAAKDYGAASGRLALADEILDPANPFASRVIVNRVWHHLFGRGIVPTVDNFGVLGQPPSRPRRPLPRLPLAGRRAR